MNTITIQFLDLHQANTLICTQIINNPIFPFSSAGNLTDTASKWETDSRPYPTTIAIEILPCLLVLFWYNCQTCHAIHCVKIELGRDKGRRDQEDLVSDCNKQHSHSCHIPSTTKTWKAILCFSFVHACHSTARNYIFFCSKQQNCMGACLMQNGNLYLLYNSNGIRAGLCLLSLREWEQ